MNKLKSILFSALIFLVLSSQLWAGVYFESETHSNIEPEVRKTQTFVSGTKMKTMIDGYYGWVIDLSAGKLIDYDLREKTFYEISLVDMSKEWEEIGAKMSSREGENKEPEQPLIPEMIKVKKKKKILDYECSLLQVNMSPSEKQDLWVTSQIPFTEEVLHFWRAFYRSSSSALKEFGPLKQHFELMSKLDSFVMSRTTKIQAPGLPGAFEEEEVVVKIESRNIGNDVFELPKDLQRKDSSL